MLLDVAQLGIGVGFGELALLNDAPRSATIYTIEDSQFAILEKADFTNIMAKVIREKFASQVQFLSKFPYLNHLTRKGKEKLCFFLKQERYTIGQKILKEGQPNPYIYLISSGEFEVSKAIYVNHIGDTDT